jgi:hypothetical protein
MPSFPVAFSAGQSLVHDEGFVNFVAHDLCLVAGGW